LAVVLLTGSAAAVDPRETAWMCSPKEDAYPAKYAVEGKKLKKHDPAEDEFAKLSEDYRYDLSDNLQQQLRFGRSEPRRKRLCLTIASTFLGV
jgi:hypothetical protein